MKYKGQILPYKGADAAATDVILDQMQMFCTDVTALVALVKVGRVCPMGMATLKRSALLPEIPAISGQGLKGFEVTSWTGVAAPAKTPHAMVQKLHDALAKIAATDDMKNLVQQQGAELTLLGPQAFVAEIQSDLTKGARVIKAAKVTLE